MCIYSFRAPSKNLPTNEPTATFTSKSYSLRSFPGVGISWILYGFLNYSNVIYQVCATVRAVGEDTSIS